jgi:hypothetical protein
VQVLGCQTQMHNESKCKLTLAEVGRTCLHVPHYRPIMNPRGERFEYEHICWYPKDGELCLNRVKPGETLVEARSDSDVQIDRQIWV